MRREPERMLRNHKESLARLQVTSKTFQRVEVASEDLLRVFGILWNS